MKPGQKWKMADLFFKNGDKIAEVIGTPKAAIDDGTLGNRTI